MILILITGFLYAQTPTGASGGEHESRRSPPKTPTGYRRAMAGVILDHLSFEEATVEEVVRHLVAQCREKRVTVNLLLREPDAETTLPAVTWDLRGISAWDALLLLRSHASLRMEVRHGVLILTPP